MELFAIGFTLIGFALIAAIITYMIILATLLLSRVINDKGDWRSVLRFTMTDVLVILVITAIIIAGTIIMELWFPMTHF